MDYARSRLLGFLAENADVHCTVANDFSDLARWLPGTRLLITYVAGPYADAEQNEVLREWLESGGRWLALHGSSGGKAAPVDGNRLRRQMVKLPYHQTLGGFFLSHPPIRKFRVDVADREHPLTKGLPPAFEVMDELYLLVLQQDSRVLLTTELAKDPAPGFGFAYEGDPSLLPDGKTRVLGYTKDTGRGAVAYFALGHCHSPTTNVQPFVDKSVEPSGETPLVFRGSWETEAFQQLLRNAIAWGTT
jgi:type 1 glutamine amidotransferase